MNPNGPRTSNLAVCFTLIFLGFLCLVGTIFIAIYLKNSLVERFKPAPRFDLITVGFEIQTLDWQIEAKENSIKIAKELSGLEQMREKLKGLDKLVNKKVEINQDSSGIEDRKAEKVKQLEQERSELIAKKNALKEQQKAKENKTRSWSELADDYQLKLFLSGVLPLGIFSWYLLNLTFGSRLPSRNPLSLTDFERRCV